MASLVSVAKNNLVVMGGIGGQENYFADVWTATSGGDSWTLTCGSPPWQARSEHRIIESPFATTTYLMGGISSVNGLDTLFNDVWVTDDNGEHGIFGAVCLLVPTSLSCLSTALPIMQHSLSVACIL
jgi:hypothetical protein